MLNFCYGKKILRERNFRFIYLDAFEFSESEIISSSSSSGSSSKSSSSDANNGKLE